MEDLTSIIDQLEKKAEEGDIDLQFELAARYLNGNGLPGNLTKGAYWLKKAAQSGNCDAQSELALCYFQGTLVIKDEEQAAYWWRKAADQDVAASQYNLGYLYKEGIGVEQNFENAAFWFGKATDQDFADAQNSLGILYDKGQGVDKDYKKAIQLFELAAEKGHVDALNNLLLLYVEGKGVPSDLDKVTDLMNQAAQKGDRSPYDLLVKIAYEDNNHIAADFLCRTPGKKKSEKDGIVVSQMGGGDFKSISDALNHAPSNSVIVLKPGNYEEKLEITKNITIIGDGNIADITISSDMAGDFFVKNCRLDLKNVTIRGGLRTDGSTLVIENCDVYDYYRYGIEVNYGSHAAITGCLVHDARSDDAIGVYIDRNSITTVESSKIFNNSSMGIFASDNSRVEIKKSRIHANWSGIGLKGRSEVFTYHCDLLDNDYASVYYSQKDGRYVPDENTPGKIIYF